MTTTINIPSTSVPRWFGWLSFLCCCVSIGGCGVSRDEASQQVVKPTAADTPASLQPAEVAYENQDVSEAVLLSWTGNPSLRRLRLASSNISDTELARLAENTQLELLDVTGCESIGAAGIDAMGQMTSLRNLRISGAAVNDETVKSLSKLTNLAALSMQQTAVTDEGLSVIASMPKLKELNLYAVPVTDASLATIAPLSALQKLRLRNTGVTGENAEAFARMAAVVELDLSETAFGSEGLAAINEMPSLRRLNLWLTKVDDAGIQSLQSQRQLTQLNLDNVSGITDQSLDTIMKMSDLELLHLGGTSVTAAGLPKLYGLTKLKTLFLTRLDLMPADVQALRQAMPWITKLES